VSTVASVHQTVFATRRWNSAAIALKSSVLTGDHDVAARNRLTSSVRYAVAPERSRGGMG
jgi:hypothetical protein